MLEDLNGNTIRLLESWYEWMELRKKHPRHSERLFIIGILKIATSGYYRKRKAINNLPEGVWEEFVEYKNQQRMGLSDCLTHNLELDEETMKLFTNLNKTN